MRMKIFCEIGSALAIVFLTGCAHQFSLYPYPSGSAAKGTANEIGKTVTVELNGETYTGKYTHDGGAPILSTTSGSMTAFNGVRTTTAYGSATTTGYVPGSGAGRMLAISPSGKRIRCEFQYRNGSGLGLCEDTEGVRYDLMIHN